MSDGYQVGVLSLLNVCFARIYGDAFTAEMSTRLGIAMFVGVVMGQVKTPRIMSPHLLNMIFFLSPA